MIKKVENKQMESILKANAKTKEILVGIILSSYRAKVNVKCIKHIKDYRKTIHF